MYRGSVGFRADRVRMPDGRLATREWVEHPGAAAIVALRRGSGGPEVLLVRQYRYAVKKVTWEIPAGKLDRREPPAVCARRELREEAGHAARRLKRLLSFWPTPAFSDEIIHIYLATGLRRTLQRPDADEVIRARWVPLPQALAWVRRGKIRDSKSVIGLLLAGGF